MKLVTFTDTAGTRIGLAVDGGIVDLKKADADLPRDMIGLMSAWHKHCGALARAATRKADVSQSAIKLEAPVQRPGKILAIGLNYADHIAESGQPTPTEQVWFAKMPTSVNGPFEDIQLPKASHLLDYEAELVVVIGKRCKHVPKDQAHEVIFGYAVGNDVTARDWAERERVWRRVLDDFNLAPADAGVIVAVDVDKAWHHRPANDPAVWAAALDAARARRAGIERLAARFRERLADRP